MADNIFKLIRSNRSQNLEISQTYKPAGEGYSETGVTGTMEELEVYKIEDTERRREESERQRQEAERKSNRDKKS